MGKKVEAGASTIRSQVRCHNNSGRFNRLTGNPFGANAAGRPRTYPSGLGARTHAPRRGGPRPEPTRPRVAE